MFRDFDLSCVDTLYQPNFSKKSIRTLLIIFPISFTFVRDHTNIKIWSRNPISIQCFETKKGSLSEAFSLSCLNMILI